MDGGGVAEMFDPRHVSDPILNFLGYWIGQAHVCAAGISLSMEPAFFVLSRK